MSEFEIEPEQPGEHQQVHQIGIGETIEDVLAKSHRTTIHGGVGQLKRDFAAAADDNLTAGNLAEQIPKIGGNKVDHVTAEGLALVNRAAVTHRLFNPFSVAAAL